MKKIKAEKAVYATKKIRKGDKVVAIAGNNKGQQGTVLKVIGDKVIVQGLNLRKRHVKRSQQNTAGGIIEMEKPIHVSNLSPSVNEGEPVKLKVKANDKGEKQLVYKDGDQDKVYRSLKKHNN
ncbi:50S ribosomal protein L24 [Criblamydia sequanensis]|uniref:Large ribosomal subunit protein uL24 n=1 Tax=Candidatus Criblamydia sequanensis CRIB-18 TaxID=1437425 RepID=A0A090DVS5_9BACT|nr:50S ribosomal protein L24 [Criblamydia sequanensis]CDR33064.1 50S ribosomal protein L24 [Criblamydia sequanensis CRIB-18]